MKSIHLAVRLTPEQISTLCGERFPLHVGLPLVAGTPRLVERLNAGRTWKGPTFGPAQLKAILPEVTCAHCLQAIDTLGLQQRASARRYCSVDGCTSDVVDRCPSHVGEEESRALIAWLRSPPAQLAVHAALRKHPERSRHHGAVAQLACETLAQILGTKTVETRKVTP